MAVADGVIYFGTDFGELYALAGICGDVDCNNNVNSLDAIKTYNREYFSKWSADVDCNNNINSLDAMKIFNRDFNCCGC